MTEVWFRNPVTYIKECAEAMVPNLAWDRGLLVKRRIDVKRYVETVYPAVVDYRMLLIGDQGSCEIRRNSTFDNPTAVYPTWEYGLHQWEELEEMCANPVGENVAACSDMRVRGDERPVFGQEHRVVVTRYPDASTNVGKAFLKELALLQREYPDCIIHIHGSYSYRVAFGMGFRAADIDSRTPAQSGKIVLGNGKAINHVEAPKYTQWVHLHNVTFGDLDVPRNRCLFNIASAQWAAANWDEVTRFKTTPTTPANPMAVTHVPPKANSTYSQDIQAKPGDKIVCDSCSLFSTCKYARVGNVCAIPDTDGSKLAKKWQTRDSDLILSGVAEVMVKMTHRLEFGMEAEEETGELDPEVTRIGKILMQEGGRLAKLVNPALAAAAAPKIGMQINLGSGDSSPAPNAVAATIIAEIEAKGVPRDQITAEMIRAHMNGKVAIEASARG